MSKGNKNVYHLLSTYYMLGTLYSLHNLILIILQDLYYYLYFTDKGRLRESHSY